MIRHCKKHKRLYAMLISLALAAAMLLPLRAPLRARELGKGSEVTLRTRGRHFPVHMRFANGATLIYDDSNGLEIAEDSTAVFCVEPGLKAGKRGQVYRARETDEIILNGRTTVAGGFRLAPDRRMTAAQRYHLALYVYHGWDSSPVKSDAERMAVQYYIWQYLWPVTISLKNPSQAAEIAAIQADIAKKVKNHGVRPSFSGEGYDPARNTVTIRPGESVRLKDKHNVLGSAAPILNEAGIKWKTEGDSLLLTADENTTSGLLRFAKYKDIEADAKSYIFVHQNFQKVAYLKADDPVLFDLKIESVRNGKLKLAKEGENKDALDGASFSLLSAEGKTVPLEEIRPGVYQADPEGKAAFTTHKGLAEVGNLQEGRYTLKEIKAPAGYLKEDKAYALEIKAGEETLFTLQNKRQRFSLELKKEDPDGRALEGAVFALKDPEGKVLEELVSGPDGRAKSREHPLVFPGGRYSAEEIKAPKGYVRDKESIRYFIPDAAGKRLEIKEVFKNDYQNFRLKIEKTNPEGEPLEGAEFTLEDPRGNILEKVITEEDGRASFSEHPLLYPDEAYHLYESRAPFGYYISEAAERYFVPEADQSERTIEYQFSAENQRQGFQVTVQKRDERSGNPLSGAVFLLKDPEGGILEELCTGPEGTVTSARHPLYYPGGLYSLEEIQAPPGYALPENPLETFKVEPEGNEISLKFDFNFTNKALKAPVSLQKYELEDGPASAPGLSLADARYLIIARALFNPENADYQEGDVVCELRTDAQGRAVSEPLHLGSYDLVEAEAPEGYLINETAVRFSLQQDGEKVIVSQDSFNEASLLEELNQSIRTLNTVWKSQGAKREAEADAEPSDFVSEADLVTAERQIKGRVEINKVFNNPDTPDGEAKEAEADIVFRILNSAGAEVDRMITNEDGWAASRLLPYGHYTLEQVTEQPHAYSVKPIDFEIEEDGQKLLYQLQNEAVTARLRIIKKDKESGQRIPQEDIRFELYKEDGSKVTQRIYYPEEKEISVFCSGPDGTVTLPEALSVGRYQLKEVKGPEGYVLPEEGEVIEFEITKDSAASGKDYCLELEIENQPAKGEILINKSGPVLSGWEKSSYAYEAISEVRSGDVTEEAEQPAPESTETLPASLHDDETEETADGGEDSVPEAGEPEGDEIEITEDAKPEAPAAAPESLSYKAEIRHAEIFTPVFETDYLPGAVFAVRAKERIYHADGRLAYEAGETVCELETCGSGAVSSGELPLGVYEIEEIQAPPHYVRDPEITEIRLSREHPSQALVQESVLSENSLQEGSVRLKKEMEASPYFGRYEGAAEKVRFGIYNKEPIVRGDIVLPEDSCLGVSALDEKMEASFSKLFPGEAYYIRELATAAEYVLNEAAMDLYLEAEEAAAVTHKRIEEGTENKLKEHSYVLKKYDREDPDKVLQGARFRLVADTVEGEKELGIFETDAQGMIRIDHLHAGSYYLEEIQAPAGYCRNPERIPLLLDGMSSLKQGKAENDQTTTIFKKTDIAGEEIAGAALEIFDSKDQLVHSWISEAGKSEIIRGLKTEEIYTLRERLSPEGYVPAQEIQFSLTEDGLPLTVEMLNELTKTEITKCDIGGRKIPGAHLEILSEDGKLLASWISEEDRSHTVEGLRSGARYILRETLAPEGYVKAEEHAFTVNEDGSVTQLKLVNERIPERPKQEIPKTGEKKRALPLALSCQAAGAGLLLLKRKRKKDKA